MKRQVPEMLTKSTMILIVFLFLGTQVYSQKYTRFKPKTKCYIGGGLENFSSGNWHGTFFSPYMSANKGRNSFSVGPMIQQRSMKISGGKFAYSYNLSGGKEQVQDTDEEESNEDYVSKKPQNRLLQLNIFGFAQYINNTPLSKVATITEQKTALEYNVNIDWNKVRLSTAEAGIGFELYLKITKRVSWKNYIAGSVYYHVNYIQGMYHERLAPSLLLGTGIHICPL